MRVSAPRLVYVSNFLHQNPSLRFKSLSSLAQVSTYCSDEQSSPNNDHFVEFTTFRVTEMIHKLSAEPANAYSLFHQLKSSGFKHDLYTYLSLIRVLCSPKKLNMYLDSVLREVILSGKSNLGFEISDLYDLLVEEATKEDAPDSLSLVFDVLLRVYMSLNMCEEACENFIQTLFQTREKEKGLLHLGTVNYFLNWLIGWNDGEKIDLVFSIYEELKKRPLNSPDVYTYGIVIKANFIKGCGHAALEVLKDMDLAGVTPSSETYTIFIEHLCKTGNAKTGYEYLQTLRSEENIQFDVYAYKVMIGGFVREGNFEKAELIMNEIEELGLVVDQDCYRILIQGYCGIRDMKRCFALHHKMRSKGIDTNSVIIGTILQCFYKLYKYVKVVKCFKYYDGLGIYFDVVPFIIVVNALCKMRRTEEAMAFIIKKMDLDVRTYTTLMNSYFRSKRPQEACKLFLEMRSRVKLDEISYRCLTYGLSRSGGERRIKCVLDDMESQGLEPSPNTHKRILKGLCTEGKVEEAKDYMSAIVPDKTPDICAAMIDGCFKSQDKDKTYNAYDLFLMFSHKNILLTRSCYLKLLKLLCDEGEVDAARQVYQVSINAFPIPCTIMHKILVEALCRAGDIKEARQVFNSIILPPAIKPDVSTYTIMLQGYCSRNLMRHAWDFFKEMQEGQVKPDLTTYTFLMDKYYKMGKYGQGDRIVSMMMRAGIEPDKAMYQTRIAAYHEKPHIHKVVSLFNEMSSKGMYPDESTIRMIRRGLIKACGIHRSEQTSKRAVSGALICLTGGVALSALDDLIILNGCSSKSMEKASKSSSVIEAIGEPILRGPWYNASLTVTHERQSVSCTFPVSGPQGSGIL